LVKKPTPEASEQKLYSGRRVEEGEGAEGGGGEILGEN